MLTREKKSRNIKPAQLCLPGNQCRQGTKRMHTWPFSVVGLLLHITASVAATDSPVRVYLSTSSKSTKVDVVIPSVGPLQLKVYNFAIEFA